MKKEIKLTKKDIEYVDKNLKEKTIIAIAKELSDKKGLEGEDRIMRKDLVKYFEDKLGRQLYKEKFEING